MCSEDGEFRRSGPQVRRLGHRFVPVVVEQFGRLGIHAQALLRELADRAVSRGRILIIKL
jgi:hypothetical protein